VRLPDGVEGIARFHALVFQHVEDPAGVLARTDRHNHRPVAGDSELAMAVKVLARAHQGLVWTRQRQTNQLRSTLREF
jgi:hypothetical protein